MSKPNKQVQRMFRKNEKVIKIGATAIVGTTIALSCYSYASADTIYDDSSYRGIGYMMKVDEVGVNGNGGTIGFVKSDAGGVSYGICQMATNAGTPDNFVEWLKESEDYNEYYKFFEDQGNPNAGTTAFGTAWTNAYNSNNRGFEKAQMKYVNEVLIPMAYNNVKENYGIDMKKSRARIEMLYSTAINYGAKGICDLFDHISGLTDDTDDITFVEKFETAKYESVGVYKFTTCNNSVRKAARDRFTREKEELLRIAQEEAEGTLDEYKGEENTSSGESKSATELLEEEAEKYDGATYQMGAKQPEKTNTVDCSGLVANIANDLGCDVDEMMTNALKFSQDSEKISRDELQPGDLVFWNDHTGTAHSPVCHIAIYLGGDTLLNSSPSTNGVGTRSLSELKDDASTTYTYGRYAPLTEAIQNHTSEVQEILEKIEFEDVIEIDSEEDKEIEEVAEAAEQQVEDTMKAIEDGTIEDNTTEDTEVEDEFDSIIEDEEPTEETTEEDKEETTTEDEDSTEDIEVEDKEETTEEDKEETTEEDKDSIEEETETPDEESDDKVEDTKDTTEESEEETEVEEADNSLDGVLAIGDSHIANAKEEIESRGGTVMAYPGLSASAAINDTSYFGEALIDKLPEDSEDINTIVVSLGINNITSNTNEEDLIQFIKDLQEKYPNKQIQLIKVTPVGEDYNYLDKDKVNDEVDNLNEAVENYVEDQEDVNIIDATSQFVNEDGYLDEDNTQDGLHLTQDNISDYVDNIENGKSETENKDESKDSKDESTDKEETDNTDKESVEDNNQKDETSEIKEEEQQEVETPEVVEEPEVVQPQENNNTEDQQQVEQQTEEVQEPELKTVEENNNVTVADSTSVEVQNDTSVQTQNDQEMQQIQERLNNNIFSKLFK